MRDELEGLLEADVWRRPAARELTLWLVALTAPACVFARPPYAMQVAWHALTRRKAGRRG